MTEGESDRAKPCIALMGEFSAGKSTLANLLIGSNPLPVQVIATQLPPVWISYGSVEPYRADLDGVEYPIDINALEDVPLEDTAYIRIYCEEDILRQCDFLDMPGISDPNMSADVWQRMIACADGVIWCSHATQAWRQSEAAVWADMDPELYDRSILLLTRVDKLLSDDDRARVLKRVRRETKGLFATCLPISLLQATDQQDDYEVWSKSGAAEFAESLADLLSLLHSESDFSTSGNDEARVIEAASIPAFAAPKNPKIETIAEDISVPQIVPRRISATGQSRRPTARP